VLEIEGQNAVIKVKNAKKIYKVGDEKLHALDGVDLEIYEGEFCLIVGRSGSGKSTLLNLIAGLEHATSGEIIINGKHIEKMNQSELIHFRQKNVGFIFQSFNLIPSMTALENTALPLTFRGISRKTRLKKAREMLGKVGVDGQHMKHKPSQLSGGQQQRVGIARALVSKPKIVFADEPTGNLDSKTSEEVMTLFTQIFKPSKTTFVMVTHDPTMSRYADKVVHILDGRIIDIEYPQKQTDQKEVLDA
jgi:putative ABC transport system ATP-binding protein